MAGREKSESLFGSSELKVPPRPMAKQPTPEEVEAFKKKLKNDYIFKAELEEGFKSDLQEHFPQRAQGPEVDENRGVIKQIDRMKEHIAHKENVLLNIINKRRQRHYSLNGDIKVFCYVKNEWPKIIIEPLTINIQENAIIPSLGPFNGENEMLLEATFRPITLGIKRMIDPFIYEPLGNTGRLSINTDEYKKLAFFCCFKSWNIPLDLPFSEDGKLDNSVLEFIEKSIHPGLFETVAAEFLSLNEISMKEMEALDQQCDRLFGKNSKGIDNPFEGIKLYCEASVFAKEFSLSGNDLNNLSYRVASLIRHVANKGSEIHSKEMDATRNKPKRAKVIGARKR